MQQMKFVSSILIALLFSVPTDAMESKMRARSRASKNFRSILGEDSQTALKVAHLQTNTSLPSSYSCSGWQLIGCKTKPAKVKFPFFKSVNMTRDVCLNHCKSVADSTSFGLEGGDTCYCLPYEYEPDRKDLVTGCDVPCTGNSSQMCGGQSDLYTMYKIDNCENPPMLCLTGTGLPSVSGAQPYNSTPYGKVLNCKNLQDSFGDHLINNYCEVECAEGFRLQHNSIVCSLEQADTGESYAAWSGDAECSAYICGEPDCVANAVNDEVKGEVSFPNYATYRCLAGYTLDGTPGGDAVFKRYCLATGIFQEPYSCKPIVCGPAPVDPFADLKTTFDTYNYEREASYECKDGYTIDGDPYGIKSYIKTCKATSKFSNETACQPVSCNSPRKYANSMLKSMRAKDVKYPTELTYHCNVGYSLDVRPQKEDSNVAFTSSCTSTGAFSMEKSPCQRISCGIPVAINNSAVVPDGFAFFGDVVVYTCDIGYTTDAKPLGSKNGGFSVGCGASGEWLPHENKCLPVICPTMPVVGNSTVVQSCISSQCTYSEQPVYKCNPGYSTSPEDDPRNRSQDTFSIQCRETGAFDPPQSCFNLNNCVLPFTKDPGAYGTCVDNEVPTGDPDADSSTVCLSGYEVSHRTRVFEGTPMLDNNCTNIDDCPLSNSFAYQCGGTDAGKCVDQVNAYKCDCEPGYLVEVLKGPSNSNSTCRPKGCGPIPNISNAKFDHPTYDKKMDIIRELKSNLTVDDMVLYEPNVTVTCDEGFTLSGTASGTKSFMMGCVMNYDIVTMSPAQTCSNVTCGKTYVVPNSLPVDVPELFYAKEFDIRSVWHQCEDGYTNDTDGKYVEGAGFYEECKADGSKTPILTCVAVNCGAIGEIANAASVPSGNVLFPNVVKYQCLKGYSTDASPDADKAEGEVSCQADGKLTHITPCQAILCGSLPLVTESDHVAPPVLVKPYVYPEVAVFTTLTGYTVDGAPDGNTTFPVKCLPAGPDSLGEQLNQFLPRVMPVLCGTPPHVPNSAYDAAERRFGDIVQYRCDEGFSLDGQKATGANSNFSIGCKHDGQFEEKQNCQPVMCPNLPQPDHIKMLPAAPTPYVYGDDVTFECAAGYSLNGFLNGTTTFNVSCLFDGTFSTPAVKCWNIKDCLYSNCTNYGSCYDYPTPNGTHINDYTCRCQSGFLETIMSEAGRQYRTCVNIDDCEEDSCNPGSCRDLINSYQCICPSGYYNATKPGISSEEVCLKQSCGTPPPQANAEVHGLEVLFEGIVPYTCKTGYTLTGEAGDEMKFSTDCLAGAVFSKNGSFNSINASCLPVRCGAPPLSPNTNDEGVSKKDELVFPENVTYTCEPGYTTDGKCTGVTQFVRTCNAAGDLEFIGGTEKKCLPVLVGKPSLSNAEYVKTDMYYPQTRVVTCKPGYSTDGLHPDFDNFTLVTKPDCSWAEHDTCKIMNCGIPREMTGASRSVSSNMVYQEKVVYTAESCYSFNGLASGEKTSEATCLETGRFSPAKDPLPIKCDPLWPLPANAHVQLTGWPITCGQTMGFACWTGYSTDSQPVLPGGTNGAFKVTCTSSGKFTTPQECKPVTCGETPEVPHAKFIQMMPTFSVRTFSFPMKVKSYPSKTGFMQGAENADKKTGVPAFYPHTAKYYTDPGWALETKFSFQPKRTFFLTCGVDGKFSKVPQIYNMNDCENSLCSPNGKCEDNEVPTGNHSVDYKCICDYGHRVEWIEKDGVAYQTCENPIDCPKDACLPGHCVDKLNDYSCECTDGYYEGIHKTKQIKDCLPKSCGTPPDRDFAKPETNKEQFFPDRVQYNCSEGYVLESAPVETAYTAECAVTPNTGGDVAFTYDGKCVPIKCPDPDPLANATKDKTSLEYPQQVTYTCSTGFTLDAKCTGSDKFTLSCSKHGEIVNQSGLVDFSECQKVSAGKPEEAKLPNAQFDKFEMFYLDTLSVNCLPGFSTDQSDFLKDSFTISAKADCSFDIPAQCKPLMCGAAPVVTHTTMSNKATDIVFPTKVSYTTVEGYTLDGTASGPTKFSTTCNTKGKFDSVTDHQPQRVSCGKPKKVDNAKGDLEAERKYTDTVTYTCNVGFSTDGEPGTELATPAPPAKAEVTVSTASCGPFSQLPLEEAIRAWDDRADYKYRNVPTELIGGTMFRGCHKVYPKGTVFTLQVPAGSKICVWYEATHMHRNGGYPDSLPALGFTKITTESMKWEFSSSWQLEVDILCTSQTGTISLPPTTTTEFTGGFVAVKSKGLALLWEKSLTTRLLQAAPSVSVAGAGKYVMSTANNGAAVWNDRPYVFSGLSPALQGATMYQGPVRMPSGDVLTLDCGDSGGVFYALIDQGRAGTFKTTLPNAGWTKTTETAIWLGVNDKVNNFDVYSKSGCKTTLPASSGSDTIVTFLHAKAKVTAELSGNKQFQVTCQSSGEFSPTKQCIPVKCKEVPSPPANSVKVTPDGSFVYKDTVQYKCKPGWSLDGKLEGMQVFEGTCQADGTFTKLPECLNMQDCTKVPNKDGQCEDHSLPIGEHLKDYHMNCDSGYEEIKSTSDTSSHTCRNIQNCTATSCLPGNCTDLVNDFSCDCPVGYVGTGGHECKRRSCGIQPDVVNAENPKSPELFYEDMHEYKCKPGYRRSRTPSWKAKHFTIKCEATGEVTGMQQCVPVTCNVWAKKYALPPPVTNTTFSNTVEYTCLSGYSTKGDCGTSSKSSFSMKCSEDGSMAFVDKEPQACKANSAGQLTEKDVPNANIIPSSEVHYPQLVQVSCFPGYSTEPTDLTKTYFQVKSTPSCGFEKYPSCQAIKCNPPPVVDNVIQPPSAEVYFGATVKYDCKPGFTLDAKPLPDSTASFSMSCYVNATWGKPKECKPVQCGLPRKIPHARPNNTDMLTFVKNTVTYKCLRGYTLNGKVDGPSEFTVTCTKDGDQAGAETCQRIECATPANKNHSQPLLAQPKYLFLDEAKYTCNHGYSVDGKVPKRPWDTEYYEKCFWDGKITDHYSCTDIDYCLTGKGHCGGGSNSSCVDGLDTYSCICGAGYETKHAPDKNQVVRLLCTEVDECTHANYSGNEMCGHGKCVDGMNKYTCDCNVGYEAIDMRGLPSGRQRCKGVECGQLPYVENAEQPGVNKLIYPQSASWTCDLGYTTNAEKDGPKTFSVSCQSNRNFTKLQECKPIKCPAVLPTVANADTNFKGQLAYVTGVANYTCHQGYTTNSVPEGPNNFTVECDANGEFEGQQTCQAVSCGDAPIVSNSEYEDGEKFFGMSTAYKCAVGYSTDGDVKGPTEFAVACNASGQFTGVMSCNPVSCGTPPKYSNATLDSNEKVFQQQTVVQCDQGFTVTGEVTGEDSFTIKCGSSGKYAKMGKYDACKPIICGKPSIKNHSKPITDATVYYSQRATWECNKDYSVHGLVDDETRFELQCEANGKFADVSPTDCLDIDYCHPDPCGTHGTCLDCSTQGCAMAPPSKAVFYKGSTSKYHHNDIMWKMPSMPNLPTIPKTMPGFLQSGALFKVDAFGNYACMCQVGYDAREFPPGNLSCAEDQCHKNQCGIGGSCVDLTKLLPIFGNQQKCKYKCNCKRGYQESTTGPDNCPSCSPLVCYESPPDVPNAALKLHKQVLEKGRSEVIAFDSLVYECALGHSTDGSTAPGAKTFTSQCNENGIVTHMRTCMKIVCDKIHLINLNFQPVIKPKIKEYYSYGDEIDISCQPGYNLYDKDNSTGFKMTCTETSVITGLKVCKPNICGTAKDLKTNAIAHRTGIVKFREMLFFRCPSGHEHIQTDKNLGVSQTSTTFQVHCLADGFGPAYSCLPVKCPYSPPAGGKSISKSAFLLFGQSVTENCPAGYRTDSGKTFVTKTCSAKKVVTASEICKPFAFQVSGIVADAADGTFRLAGAQLVFTKQAVSTKTCSELGWQWQDHRWVIMANGFVQTGVEGVCGQVPDDCSVGKKNHAEAKKYCTDMGARLCTKDEMQKYEPCKGLHGGDTCSYDDKEVWTATPCSEGFLTFKCSDKTSHCASASATNIGLAGRCCADTAADTGTGQYSLAAAAGTSGRYTVRLPPGTYYVTAKYPNYIDRLVDLSVTGKIDSVEGSPGKGDIALSREMASDEWRIVLNWDETSRDLDSWTSFGKNAYCDPYQGCTGPCDCGWYNRIERCQHDNSGVTAELEWDVTQGWGPETTHLKGIGKCQYQFDQQCVVVFSVWNYTPQSKEMKKSKGTVTVFRGKSEVANFDLADLITHDAATFVPVLTINAATGEFSKGDNTAKVRMDWYMTMTQMYR